MTEVVLLEDLIVNEISLVDAGAHLRDGWSAMKARGVAAELAAVVAKNAPHRVASAVGYEPLPHVDAHGEGVDPATLSVAMLRYATSASKVMRLQHQPGTSVGLMIGLLAWPVAKSVDLCVTASCTRPRLSPFTVYTISRFSPDAYEALLDGRTAGLSIGGSTKRRAGAESTAKTETPEAGWLWTSEPRIAAIAKAAELRQAQAGVWAIPKTLDATSLDSLWEATMGLRFLDVGGAAKSGGCRCGGACAA